MTNMTEADLRKNFPLMRDENIQWIMEQFHRHSKPERVEATLAQIETILDESFVINVSNRELLANKTFEQIDRAKDEAAQKLDALLNPKPEWCEHIYFCNGKWLSCPDDRIVHSHWDICPVKRCHAKRPDDD